MAFVCVGKILMVGLYLFRFMLLLRFSVTNRDFDEPKLLLNFD